MEGLVSPGRAAPREMNTAHRLAIVTACAAFLLIVVGGLVTSTGVAAMKRPLRPPMIKSATKEIANSIGEVSRMEPRHIVASQLKTFTPDGNAMSIVVIMNIVPSGAAMPLTNMWWPQTMKPRPMIEHIEAAMTPYPKIGFREKVAMISLATPMPGRIRMYTAGWE